MRAVRQVLPDLPPFVPTVQPSQWLSQISLKAAAVPLRRVVSASGSSTLRGCDMRLKLHLSPQATLICIAFGKDQALENIDPYRRQRMQELAGLGFNLVTSLDYSSYDVHWPPDRLNNQIRNLISFELLQAAGAPAIPHLGWSNERDIERVADWLWANPFVTMVAFDLQSPGAKESDWRDYLESLDRFRARAPALRYLVSGVSGRERLEQVRVRLGDVVFANERAYQQANHGHEEFCVGGVTRSLRSTATKADILENYVAYFEQLALGSSRPYEPVGTVYGVDLPVLSPRLSPGRSASAYPRS